MPRIAAVNESTSLLLIVALLITVATVASAAVVAPLELSPKLYSYAAGLAAAADSDDAPAGLLGAGGIGTGAVGVGGLGAAEPGDLSFADGMNPPDPSKFRTPEELKDYLERLQLYYALVGRPRFGKRSGYARRSRRGWQGENGEDNGDRIYGYAVLF